MNCMVFFLLLINFLHLQSVTIHLCLFPNTVDTENESASSEPKAAKETIDFKELKRVDHILASLQRKVYHILDLLNI